MAANTDLQSGDTDNSRERILKVAAEEFAREGFAGARVDVIAEKAQVNKALIYYYFKSKKNLLDILIGILIDKGIGLAKMLTRIDGEVDANYEEGYALFNQVLALFEENESLIRIIMMESLKLGGEDVLGRLLTVYMDSRVLDVVDEMKSKGVRIPEDTAQWIVTELFTALLPSIMFVLFRDNLGHKLGKTKEGMNELFINAIAATHLKTHLPD
ncbi:MAG: TetR/AcrR family transcriptional regulator [Spirochaetales bacterium]|nr:TetR/AcrR family transcriptional regulator [Spirochaetales bacterium]